MIKLNIVTIEGIVFKSEQVESITLPTSEGVLTVKPDHVPLFANVISGEIEIDETNERKTLLAISKGILQINPNSIINILADTAETAEDIDLTRAAEAKKRAEEYLKQKNIEDVEFARIQAKIEKELARIQVGKKYKKI
jgi:F-type H+-transporting ATPase subunit epsilon